MRDSNHEGIMRMCSIFFHQHPQTIIRLARHSLLDGTGAWVTLLQALFQDSWSCTPQSLLIQRLKASYTNDAGNFRINYTCPHTSVPSCPSSIFPISLVAQGKQRYGAIMNVIATSRIWEVGRYSQLANQRKGSSFQKALFQADLG